MYINKAEYYSTIKREKKDPIDVGNNMNECQMHYAKWKKSDSKGYILHYFIQMTFGKSHIYSDGEQTVIG